MPKRSSWDGDEFCCTSAALCCRCCTLSTQAARCKASSCCCWLSRAAASAKGTKADSAAGSCEVPFCCCPHCCCSRRSCCWCRLCRFTICCTPCVRVRPMRVSRRPTGLLPPLPTLEGFPPLSGGTFSRLRMLSIVRLHGVPTVRQAAQRTTAHSRAGQVKGHRQQASEHPQNATELPPVCGCMRRSAGHACVEAHRIGNLQHPHEE